MIRIDMVGQVFGRLTVVERCGSKGKTSAWLCACSCGKTKIASRKNLICGSTSSCGCLVQHGHSRTKLYKVWTSMHQRCKNENDRYYYNYGGRGIKVDPHWDDFVNFYKDMGEPENGMTLDRIDNNRNYSKDNCRWSNRFEQMRNTRRTVKVAYKGVTKCLKDWSKETGLGETLIKYRLNRGWSLDEVFNTPPMNKGSRKC